MSSVSATSKQQVPEDRGNLCSGLPLLSSARTTFVGEKLAVKSEPTACLSAPMSTPVRHKIPLMGMHLLWHPDLDAVPFLLYLDPHVCFHLTAISIQSPTLEHNLGGGGCETSTGVLFLHWIILLWFFTGRLCGCFPWQQHLSPSRTSPLPSLSPPCPIRFHTYW